MNSRFLEKKPAGTPHISTMLVLFQNSFFLREKKTLRARPTEAQCLVLFQKSVFLRKKAPAGMHNISTMLVFQKNTFLRKKRRSPNTFSATRLLRCVFVSLIMIHRRSLQTRFRVTGLAQWGWTRTGAGVGSGGYRVRFQARPRVICSCICKHFRRFWDMRGTLFGYFFRTLF